MGQETSSDSFEATFRSSKKRKLYSVYFKFQMTDLRDLELVLRTFWIFHDSIALLLRLVYLSEAMRKGTGEWRVGRKKEAIFSEV